MSSNDSSVLLAWMKQNPSHLNWDLTLAMCPDHVNRLVLMAHSNRDSSALGDLEGEIPVPSTQLTHVLSGYRVGPPQLEALAAAYESPKVRHALALEGGSHLIMDKTEGLMGLAWHDPLDPLWVRQELLLSADTEGVSIDLGAENAETELDLGGGLIQRQAAGRFFVEFVRGLESARRAYPLVDFSTLTGNSQLGVRYSAVRTHVSRDDGRAALVVFAGVKDGPLGDFPGEQSDYPFLLPDDTQDPVTATLLLTSRLLHRAAYAAGLEQMLEGGEFDAVRDDSNALLRLDAKAGQLRVLPGEYQGSEYQFRSEAFVIPVVSGAPLVAGLSSEQLNRHCPTCCGLGAQALAEEGEEMLAGLASPLSVEFDVDQIRQRWASYCTLSFSYRPKGGNWTSASGTFQFDLRTLFQLFKPRAEESAGYVLLGEVLWPWAQSAEVVPVSGLPAGLAPQVLAEINAFVAFLIKQAVLEGLARKLSARVPEQIIEGMALPGERRLLPSGVHMPLGLALFGSQNTGLHIVEPPPLLAPAARHTFSVAQADGEVIWTLEALAGTVGDLGRIDPASGAYRAPPAHAMGGQQVRVRVVATDASSQRASTVVTVLLAALTVNPLIRVCYLDDQLTLTAGTLAGDLEWQVLDADAEGRGRVVPEADGKRCTYIAGSGLEDNRTYVHDQVEVRNQQSGESSIIHVLARQRRPELDVQIAEQLPDGSLQLHGRFNGQVMPDVQWALAIDGTGDIDPGTGVYTPPAGDSSARFTLIMARFELPELDMLFEGHLILPLPLALHFDAVRRIDQPAGLRVGKPDLFGG